MKRFGKNRCGKQWSEAFNRKINKKDTKTRGYYSEMFTATLFNQTQL